jgi:hypothetical protein
MIISRFFKEERVQCQIEPERVSSLTLEQEKIPLSLPPEEGAVKKDPEPVKVDDRLARIEEGADFVLEGRVIVSPIRGRNIREIKPGERIMVRLLNRDETTLNIARTLKAVNDKGEILPIVARLKEKLVLEEGGYVLYGLAAKNVLVRIIEEEDLKIEMEAVRKEEDTPG